jgi:hypothetical protein
MNKRTRDAMPQALQEYLDREPILARTIGNIVSGRTASERSTSLMHLLWMIGQVKQF